MTERILVILSFNGFKNRHRVITALFSHTDDILPFVHILPKKDNSERIAFLIFSNTNSRLRKRIRNICKQNCCTMNSTIYPITNSGKHKTFIKQQFINRVMSPRTPINIIELFNSDTIREVINKIFTS